MGIFSRMKDIASSNISDLKDRREDNEKSEKEINEYITQRALDLAEIKRSCAELIANEVRLERQCSECQAQTERFEELAKKALAAGSEEDARVFLKKKHELEKKKAELERHHAQAAEDADKIKETYNAMVREINGLQVRLRELKGREAVADAQNTFNKMSDSMDIEEAFSDMEENTDFMQSAAEAGSYADIENDPLAQEIEKLRREIGNK